MAGQGQTPLSSAQIAAAAQEYRKREKLDVPLENDWLQGLEQYMAQPAVMLGLGAASLLTGGATGAVLGGIEAGTGAASAYNRYREGDKTGATIAGALTLLGGQAAYRGARDFNRANRITEFAKLNKLPPDIVEALRRAQNLDPSQLSPELRRLVNMFRQGGAVRPGKVSAAAAALQKNLNVSQAKAAAAEAAAAPGKAGAKAGKGKVPDVPATGETAAAEAAARPSRPAPTIDWHGSPPGARAAAAAAPVPTPRTGTAPAALSPEAKAIVEKLRASVEGAETTPPPHINPYDSGPEGQPPPGYRPGQPRPAATAAPRQWNKRSEVLMSGEAAWRAHQKDLEAQIGRLSMTRTSDGGLKQSYVVELEELQDQLEYVDGVIAKGDFSRGAPAPTPRGLPMPGTPGGRKLTPFEIYMRNKKGGAPPSPGGGAPPTAPVRPRGGRPAAPAAPAGSEPPKTTFKPGEPRKMVRQPVPKAAEAAPAPTASPDKKALINRRRDLASKLKNLKANKDTPAMRKQVAATEKELAAVNSQLKGAAPGGAPPVAQASAAGVSERPQLAAIQSAIDKARAETGLPQQGVLSLEPEPVPVPVAAAAGGTPIDPPLTGTREERLQRIRDSFGKQPDEPTVPIPVRRPLEPSLTAEMQPGFEPVLPEETATPVVPSSTVELPTVPRPAVALTPPQMNYRRLEAEREAAAERLSRIQETFEGLPNITPQQAERLRMAQSDLVAADARLKKAAESTSVKEMLAEAPVKQKRKTNKSLTPEEAAALEIERDAAAAEADPGRQPWSGVPKRQPSRAQLRAEREARELAEKKKLLDEINQQLKVGQAPTNPTTGRLRATGNVLKRGLKKKAPGLSAAVDKLGEAIDKAADDLEKAPPKKPGPRLRGKDGKLRPPKGGSEEGSALTEALGQLSGAMIGGMAGAAYGKNQTKEGEDSTGNTWAGAGSGALLGFLGSRAAISKLKGRSLSEMAKKYQFFSLLSDPTVLGRASLGSMNSVLTGVTERILEKRYADANKILRQFLQDTGSLRWFRVLGAKDQTLHLPPTLRTRYGRGGRATGAPGYRVNDLPGRVISAGDITATRALHAGGYSLDDIQRMNIGGTPQTNLGRRALNMLGEDVSFMEQDANGNWKKVVQRTPLTKRQSAGMRAAVPFARMAVALPERTLAYMPVINELPMVRKALGNTSKTTARARGIIGGAALGGGYVASEYTTPETDPWLTAMAGPSAGLAQIGIGARRMFEANQQFTPFVHQQIQNLVPGVSEQFNIPGIMGRVIPGIASRTASTIDPAFGRASGAEELADARRREGASNEIVDKGIGMMDGVLANMKSRLPFLRETLPETYRGRNKFGQDLQPERNPWLPKITSDTTMRGNIFGYDVVAPKWMAGHASAAMSKYPLGDEISDRLREIETQTGIPVIGVPSQPLQDPLFTEIAQVQGVAPERIHRDIKAGIEKARGMAPRLMLKEILSPSFKNQPLNMQAIQAREMVEQSRGMVNEHIRSIVPGSLANPANREQFVKALADVTAALSGGWR